MYQKEKKSWFTLVEILVVIAIIWILALSISRFNFSRLNSRQLVQIELVKIENILQEIRDNSLVWRAVWTSLDIPVSWSINFSTSSSGTINSSYLTGSSATPVNYINWSWDAPNNSSIQNLECEDFLWNRTSTWNIILTFTGWEIGINTWCESATRNYKIMNLIFWQWSLTWSLSINTVTWTITTD